MKSTLIRWGLCWGLSLMAVQLAWAQGIPALPPGGAAEYQPPPPLPAGATVPAMDPTPVALPGGAPPAMSGYGGQAGYGMAPSAGPTSSCTGCGAPCGPSGCCDSCAANGYGSGYEGNGYGGGGGGGDVGGFGTGLFGGAGPVRGINTFGGLEYLSVWTHGQFFPVLATTSPAGTPRFLGGNPDLPNAGVLGRAGVPIFGGGQTNTDQKNGGRLTIGTFLDPANTVSWVNRFSMIPGGTNRFSATSDGTTTLGRPFFDPVNIAPAGENALLLAYTDPNTGLISRGNIQIAASSNIYLIDSYIRSMVHNDGQLQVDLLAGFEYTRIDDDLSIQSKHTFFPNPGPVTFNLHDLISAKNNFYGGVIGFDVEKRWGRFSIDTLAKLGLGSTRQQIDLHGAGTAVVGGVHVPLNGGFYVQRSNAGATLNQTYSRDVWSLVPELNVTLGYWITPHLKATLGYTGIYWTNQVQSGQVIDRRINFTQQTGPLVGPAVPAFKFADSDFWLQGFNAGIAWDF